jgi:hypothetical protein
VELLADVDGGAEVDVRGALVVVGGLVVRGALVVVGAALVVGGVLVVGAAVVVGGTEVEPGVIGTDTAGVRAGLVVEGVGLLVSRRAKATATTAPATSSASRMRVGTRALRRRGGYPTGAGPYPVPGPYGAGA